MVHCVYGKINVRGRAFSGLQWAPHWILHTPSFKLYCTLQAAIIQDINHSNKIFQLIFILVLTNFAIGFHPKICLVFFFFLIARAFPATRREYKCNSSRMPVEIITHAELRQHSVLSSTWESSEDPARDGGIINTESLPCLIEACSPRPWSSARELIKTPAESPDWPPLVGTTTRDWSLFPTSSLTIHSLGCDACEGSSAP